MEYTEFKCIPYKDGHSEDLLIAHLAELGFESFTEEEDYLCAYIPSNALTDQILESVENEDIKMFYSDGSWNVIPDQNWNAVWESAYDPVIIDDQCMIRAPFHQPRPEIDYNILIEPKMSFGTAHHETTRMMIRYLLEMEVTGKGVLDMGSGTGVLAILAAIKGAAPVLAIDNDSWAYENAKENVSLNLPDKVDVLYGDRALLEGRSFSIILANINRNILLDDISSYRKCLYKGGELIMSGFYAHDLPAIREASEKAGMSFVSRKEENNWTAARFRVA